MQRFNIVDDLEIEIEVEENRYGFLLKDLFLMAARRNRRRAFLFVSQLLGKHIPIDARRALITGKLLAFLLAEKISKERALDYKYELLAEGIKDSSKIEDALCYASSNLIPVECSTLFLGFAETATALGHALFSQYTSTGHRLEYLHTTRDDIVELSPVLQFEEEHSHATRHLCYAEDPNFFTNFDHIVLIDDELTTGKSALNLIESLQRHHNAKRFSIVSILDWRTREYKRHFDDRVARLAIPIDVVSLLHGQAHSTGSASFAEEVCYKETVQSDINSKAFVETIVACPKVPVVEYTRRLTDLMEVKQNYLKFTGRFPITYRSHQEIEAAVLKCVKIVENGLETEEQDKPTLILGTEEFIYFPMLVAANC
ncbi:MAG: phosphoribosyltransferase domain-containing protein, partial [Blastocatellia bacterium]|nr:phosphoribosyltransferase domain-containing protein [Blastocatellia bacterium]